MVKVFQIWLLLSLSDAIAGMMAARYLWLLQGAFARKKALLMAAIALESLLVFLSLWTIPSDAINCAPQPALTIRLVGRTIKAVAVWYLAFYDLGLLKSSNAAKEG